MTPSNSAYMEAFIHVPYVPCVFPALLGIRSQAKYRQMIPDLKDFFSWLDMQIPHSTYSKTDHIVAGAIKFRVPRHVTGSLANNSSVS